MVDEALLRDLVPAVIGILVRRGADFASAEDAVQDALVEAVRVWPDDPPQDPKGWLVTVAWRKFLDAARANTSRRRRELRIEGEPMPGPVEAVDDTLQLYFLCAHPALSATATTVIDGNAGGPCAAPPRFRSTALGPRCGARLTVGDPNHRARVLRGSGAAGGGLAAYRVCRFTRPGVLRLGGGSVCLTQRLEPCVRR